MAYKQPYKKVQKGVKGNDGASVPFLAAIPAIAKGIAAAAKVGKVAAVAAKAGKAATTAAKAGKTLGTAAKAAKGAGKVAKGAGKIAKSGKKGGKVFKKIGEAGKKALEKGKSIVEKGTEKIDKFKEGYDNVAGKIADKTGFDKDAIKEFGSNQAANAVSALQNKMQGGGDEPMSPAERGIPSGITPIKSASGGYEDPSSSGPNMFEHRKDYGPSIKSKYDNVGPSMKPITITNADGGNVTYRSKDGASNNGLNKFDIDKSNLFKDGFDNPLISQLSAPVTIKGVTFDAGDALRLGILGYKAGKKGIEDRKAITADKGFQDTKKQLKSTKYQKGQYKPKFKANKDAIKDKLKSIKKEIKTKK